jgi:4-diphosphocytidyl-2-C-methyl-D-erythritol kinase
MAIVETGFVEQARAKINLTLRVLGRRVDGYHALESLVVFADLADSLSLQPGGALTLEVSGPFAGACGPPAHNLVLKAAAALASTTSGRFTLDKHIPVAAGLGGGSADAAAALRLLARANGLALDDPRLLSAARATGADVPVCLESRAKIMRGAGEELSAPLDFPKLSALLVNPGVALATRDVFAAFEVKDAGERPLGDVPRQSAALIGWLAGQGNDLTAAALARAPVIAEVLAALAALPNCRLARMSGSGATCFALFDSVADAKAAERQLRATHGNWRIYAVTLG